MIPSVVFQLPGSEYVNAVIFVNTGTVAKFNRMGFLSGYESSAFEIAIRFGNCYDHEPDTESPLNFRYVVGAPDTPAEDWGQGLEVFHNPHALFPIQHNLLPLAYHFYEGNEMRSFLPEFHPIGSKTAFGRR